MSLKVKNVLTRRFVRLKAMQELYAFYIAKQADYQGALGQIQEALAFDMFAEPAVDKEQQTLDQKQALKVFADGINAHQTQPISLGSYNSAVQKAVKNAQATYAIEVNKDWKHLQNGWHKTMGTLQKNCLWVLQLLIEWKQIAHQQARRIKLSQHPVLDRGIEIFDNNSFLEALQNHVQFKELIQEYKVNWINYGDLTLDWYNLYFRNEVGLPNSTELTEGPIQEKGILYYLVENIIFKQKPIQDFLNELDLGWIVHKPVVKKLVCQILENLYEKNVSLKLLDTIPESEALANFYDNLISYTIKQERALEEVIKQHIKNWPIERLLILDKVIINLALTEMMYLRDIPIKVSINEYLELSKAYSTPKSQPFINGILDAVAKTIA
jgi:N utilization substance protein B